MSTSPTRRNGRALTPRNGRGKEYDVAARMAGMMELALAGGSTTRAARRLQERGTPVPKTTLERWKDSEEYAQIRDHQALEVQKEIAREHEDLAIQAAGVTRKLLARLDAETDDIPLRDVAGAARNTGVIGAVAVDKVMAARERPLPARAPDRGIEEIFRALRAISPDLVVGDEAELRALDVPDAEVVEEKAGTPGQGA